MANTTIDVVTKPGIDNITASAAGTLTNDVAVVIKAGTSKEEAYVTLTEIRDAIISGRVTLQ